MLFIYKKWENFCKRLANNNIFCCTAESMLNNNDQKHFVILKHDVETKVKKAYKIAKIENKYGIKGTYYVQAYLLNNKNNVDLLLKMKEMGHEVTYHHDVMDSNKGDIEKAEIEFSKNLLLFERNGFIIHTVCQHGNPIVERRGYTSNRDFFRSNTIQRIYPKIFDIMVNYKERINKDYSYISDSGRKFKLIKNPEHDDLIKNTNNISFENIDNLYNEIVINNNSIISIHPHRWCKSYIFYFVQLVFFKIVKITANVLIRIPFIKKIMAKYYYLAKKI